MRMGVCVDRLALVGEILLDDVLESRGAAGFWIDKGEIAWPVSELTVAGNLKDIFANLTQANNLEFRHGFDAPPVRVEGMTVAGQ